MEQRVYLKNDADAVIEAKDAKIAELKQQYNDMDIAHTVHIAKMNAKIEELESNERRLKRALYKACAMWADRTRLICSVFGSDAPRIRWERMLGRCRAMAEKFGG
jgi:hypothetical protein